MRRPDAPPAKNVAANGIHVSSASGASTSLWDPGEQEEVTSEYRKYKTNIMHNSAITAGDLNGDGVDEVLAVGYTDHDKARAFYERDSGELMYVNVVCSWNDSNLVYAVASFNGSGYSRGEITRLEMNEFTKKGTYTEDDVKAAE